MKLPAAWKIIISITGVAIVLFLTIAVPLIIVFVVYGPNVQPSETKYFSAKFKISNINYTANYQKQDSNEFRSMAAQIEALLNGTYDISDLKKQYTRSQVVKLSPGSVVPQFLMLFASYATGDGTTLKERVQETLLQKIQANSTGTFHIDPSSLQLQEILASEAEHLLYSVSNSTTTPGTTAQLTTEGLTGCGRRFERLSSRIVGGTEAKMGAWPWQASLLLSGVHKCGASLISDSWLVTAAHCFDWQNNWNAWTVRLGTAHLSTGDGLKLKDIIIYPNHTIVSHENDIALLRLSEPVSFTSDIRPVCLPETSQIFPDDSLCYITGWGALREGGQLSETLHQGQVKIIATEECMNSPEYNNRITASMLCAGYMNGSVDTCQGDSGGPLVTANATGPWYLVGIVSWGQGCGKPNLPGVYSRVTALRNWIASTTGL